MNRRRFLAAAALFAVHPTPAGARMLQASAASPRILSLDLQTAAPMPSMKEFYHGALGLQVIEEGPDRLTIAAGATRLTFRSMPAGSTADGGASPFYHFAFNIPENKIVAAHRWQSRRSPLLPIPPRLRDSRYPAEVVNYSHWNAHSIFFFDPGGNVVEYIARHDLKNAGSGDFGSADILYASEIAFVVDDVPDAVAKLKGVAAVQQYKGADDQFAALGDEGGLLLVMRRGREISFDAPQKKAVTVFPTRASVRAAAHRTYAFPGFPYELELTGG